MAYAMAAREVLQCRATFPSVRSGSFGAERTLVVGAPNLRLRNGVSLSHTARPPTSQVVCSATTAGSKLTEVDVNTFDAALAAAGDKLVVLDMYTQWCGPCKMLAPKLEALAQSYQDVVFIKLDCNQENKTLAKSLGVRVVPTFKLFRNKEVVAEVAGAKYDELLAAIMKNHSLQSNAPAAAVPEQELLVEGEIVEVNKDNFYTARKQAGKRLVILDMYTKWCGPCKKLAPTLAEYAATHRDVVFLKLDCNEENKPLAKALGIVSVPTVKFFKGNDVVGEVRGAREEQILELLLQHK